MWEHFEDLTSCPALTRTSDSLLLFDERRLLQTVGGIWGGVEGHRQTLFGMFASALSPTMPFSGFGHVPLLSELCVRSTRLLVILGGVSEATARTGLGGWMDGWMECFGDPM